MEPRALHSESWHRVSALKLSLRPAIQIRKQLFRGQTWYVAEDPFSNNFFRLSHSAYSFVARLNHQHSIDDIWQDCLKRQADQAPDQEEVINLLAQLYQANLLTSDLPPDSRQLFERYRKKRQQEQLSSLRNLLFIRIPLFDPEPLLKRCTAVISLLTGKLCLGLWMLMVVLALKILLDNNTALLSECRNLLAPDNLFLLYGGLILVKGFHELGHTLMCRRFGGEVHRIGIMLILFAPVPWMDATSSWAFRSRRQRILVASAGVLFELFAASCAAIIWSLSPPGQIHNLALNMMIVASVSTLLFNANPLMRYDGYYILSDLLDLPNLQSRSQAQLKYLAQRFLLGLNSDDSPAADSREARLLSLYALSSGGYRLLVYLSIVLFIADRYLIAGLLLAGLCLFNWVVLPLLRLMSWLVRSSTLRERRTRALLLSASALTVVTILMALPFPRQIRLDGIVVSENAQEINAAVAGYIDAINAEDGSSVNSGDRLMTLSNPLLDNELQMLQAQRHEIELLQQQSRALSADRTRTLLLRRLADLDERLAELKHKQQALIIHAPTAGIWTAPQLDARRSSWVVRGEELGQIIPREEHLFSAVIPQEDAAALFNRQPDPARSGVRLRSDETALVSVTSLEMIPFEQTRLPARVLGQRAGGSIATRSDDDSGLMAAEPFFIVRARLKEYPQMQMYHGQSGVMRIAIAAESLYTQLQRRIRQFIQKRYQT